MKLSIKVTKKYKIIYLKMITQKFNKYLKQKIKNII